MARKSEHTQKYLNLFSPLLQSCRIKQPLELGKILKKHRQSKFAIAVCFLCGFRIGICSACIVHDFMLSSLGPFLWLLEV